MEDKLSFRIKGKISFMGHHRYLPEDHIWHWSKQHVEKVDRGPPLVAMNEDDILQQLD